MDPKTNLRNCMNVCCEEGLLSDDFENGQVFRVTKDDLKNYPECSWVREDMKICFRCKAELTQVNVESTPAKVSEATDAKLNDEAPQESVCTNSTSTLNVNATPYSSPTISFPETMSFEQYISAVLTESTTPLNKRDPPSYKPFALPCTSCGAKIQLDKATKLCYEYLCSQFFEFLIPRSDTSTNPARYFPSQGKTKMKTVTPPTTKMPLKDYHWNHQSPHHQQQTVTYQQKSHHHHHPYAIQQQRQTQPVADYSAHYGYAAHNSPQHYAPVNSQSRFTQSHSYHALPRSAKSSQSLYGSHHQWINQQ